MPTSTHIPERTCIACRRKRAQGELLRLTRTPRGWQLLAGHRTGRGAYVCADDVGCWAEKKLRRLGTSAPALSEQLKARSAREVASHETMIMRRS
ncbi:YlxR family protein [Deinococcus peraridilitoris]|uniref:Putative nucleic-acid-binding protein implicated in transcription termination n=1 Tax=Deinococcus peraridilitoris (strain DSM 19664 / LMG 22246 / CIP 109416 / KR-200) TaxID=937777 RepID=L0A4K8_DEIPD|nr:YlxR family protein [Deinococcus peraridilitoris]AFZ68786.1 putative nucleic-acid-binding protein implicated in transcription termination [Deinococcus peraridilitoris DSM 19664]